MSRVLKVSQSNYRLQTASGGTITLDTGDRSGTTVITGNLDVKGFTTTIESTNATVVDNIFEINTGTTGNGIGVAFNYQAGFQIDRGNYSPAQITFNESISHYSGVTNSNVNGTFQLKTLDNVINGLQVATITNDGTTDLIFDMRDGNGVLRVANTTNYELRVTDDNDLVTKKWVNGYVAAQNGVASVDRIYYPTAATNGNEQSKIQTFSSTINFYVAGTTIATVSPVGITVGNVNLFQDTITNTSPNNLIFTAVNNNIEVNGVFNLDDQVLVPGSTTGKTKLYSSATAGPGKTGLYIANVNTSDELVSKNRAVLLSILF
jgi:hypothetical protein